MGCGGSAAAKTLAEPPHGCGRNCPSRQIARYGEDNQLDGKWWTMDRFATMPPRLAPDPTSWAGQPPTTLDKVFEKAAEINGSFPALRVERRMDGTAPDGSDTSDVPWREWTWRQYWEESCLAAKGMLALGMVAKSAVCIYGFNAPEWFMAQQAAIIGNAASCGIYPTDKIDNVQYKARHGACRIAVVENRKHVEVIKQAVEAEPRKSLAPKPGDTEESTGSDSLMSAHLGGIPTLRAVVVWGERKGTEFSDFSGPAGQTVRVLSWEQLTTEEAAKTSDEELSKARAELKPGGLAGYIYTSGTTGRPKAVMVSHDNVNYMVNSVGAITPIMNRENTQERILSYLPLSHVAGMLIDIAVPIGLSAKKAKHYGTVYFARPTDLSQMTLANRIKAVRPTAFLGVPRVWEKIRDTMIALARDPANKPDPKTQKRIDGAKSRGLQWAYNRQLGCTGQRPGNCIDHFIDNKVYAKIRERLGLSDCVVALTGAAPMDIACLEFFGQLGIEVNEVYGMSECCGVATAGSSAAHVWGTVGWAMPGTEVKIFRPGADNDCSANRPKEEAEVYPAFADTVRSSAAIDEKYQGEVCYRGRHIMMGYMGNPDLGEDHLETIRNQNGGAIDDEGWLHSGDKGAIDRQGILRITGRFKELIIPAGGENVSPIPIEEGLKKIEEVRDIISNVMMVGDKRKYCVALVTLRVVGATGQEPGTEELTPACQQSIKKLGGHATTVPEAMDDPAVWGAIGRAVASVNKNPTLVPNGASSIKSFTILPRDFSESGGELTATLKLKRSVVEADHASMVGFRDTRGGAGPGQTGVLYACELLEVPGVGKVYGRYQSATAGGEVPGTMGGT
eukprot:TRINITY_DN13086_c0_g1_i1.p1 TRINITY_DN13086_c0_g1~~TRINITY_DN13086_c0_g1_i1.p1  ORF type:complete len:875 (+),score=253.73 TRINITY_DN13086_c0_g1_i1:88-2625(+)